MKKKFSIRDNTAFIITGIVLIVYCTSLLIPFIWMLYSSFKGPFDFLLQPFSLPEEWFPQNFLNIFKLLRVEVLTGTGKVTYGIGTMILNSFILASGTAFMGVLIPALTAYIVSKYNFKGKKLMYSVAIATMIIPIVGALPSSLQIKGALGIINNPVLYILTSGQPFGFTFLLMYGLFKSLPWSYAEAVFIDGGGHFTVMLKIMLPLALPSLATLYVLGFIGSWNDYMGVLVYLPRWPNLAYGMYVFQHEAARYGATMPEILAGLIIVAVPSATLYLLSQKLILTRYAVGGLKG